MERDITLKPYQIYLPVALWEECRGYAAAHDTTGPAILRDLLEEWQRERNEQFAQSLRERLRSSHTTTGDRP